MSAPDPSKNFWTRFKNLPVDSTPKTIAVAVALCLFCSMVVAMAAVSLRPVQEANKLRDKRINILQVAGVYEPGIDVDTAFAAFEPRLVELATGAYSDAFEPANFDDKAASDDPDLSRALDDDPAGIGRQALYRVVYLLKDEGGALDKVILPVHGYGLWSTLYGFIALEENGNDIYGLQFYDHAETPGLGAEVDNPRWKAQWNGKKLHDEAGDLEITVSKAEATGDKAQYHIDAIAGASLTSRGVDNLVRFWMGDEGFGPYLDTLKTGDAT